MNNLHSKIIGTGIGIPKKIVTNFDYEKILDTSDAWIRERTGIVERRIADTQNGESLTELASLAATEALKNASLEANDIDFILMNTTTKDRPLPSTACLLQAKLGITNQCACLDIDAACTGFIYAFTIADSLIKSKAAKNILLCTGDVLSSIMNFSDRSTCILFGDASSAIVLSASENDESQVLSYDLGADSSGADLLTIPKGGSTNPVTEEVINEKSNKVFMNGNAVFKLATRTMAQRALKALKIAGKTKDDIDWFIPHQANIRIIETTNSMLEIPPEKVIINIQKYANTSASSIPVAFHEALKEGKIKRGDTILLDAFGAGLTSGALLLRY